MWITHRLKKRRKEKASQVLELPFVYFHPDVANSLLLLCHNQKLFLLPCFPSHERLCPQSMSQGKSFFPWRVSYWIFYHSNKKGANTVIFHTVLSITCISNNNKNPSTLRNMSPDSLSVSRVRSLKATHQHLMAIRKYNITAAASMPVPLKRM